MATPGPLVRVRLVGGFSVRVGERVLTDVEVGTRKARTVLQVLATYADRRVAMDELAEAVWPDRAPHDRAANLATLVSRLRATLGDEVIDGDRAAWQLGARVDVDLAEAERYLARARVHVDAAQPGPALTAASAALDVLAGGLLLVDESAPWLDEPRTRAAELLRQARHLAAGAALEIADPRAEPIAADAVAADPFDEVAARLLMQGQVLTGAPARALATYDRLRHALADELGVDPSQETRALHAAVLSERASPTGPVSTPRVPSERNRSRPQQDGRLAGREAEIARLETAWLGATEGRPALMLLTGEAGIGKTSLAHTLADWVQQGGGTVLEARCFRAERSLFLQPFADALRPVVVRSSPARLRELAGDRAPSLALVVPEVDDVLGPQARDRSSARLQRRFAYDAVITMLRRLSAHSPVLLVLDDLQHAGLATLELLHLLARRTGTERLMVLATVRSGAAEEGSAQVVTTLTEIATRIDVGPLSREGVGELATAQGLPEHAESIAQRTGGNPLYAVELLRAIRSGHTGVPESLRATVEDRLRGADTDVQGLARAAAVLGTVVDPRHLGGLLGLDDLGVIRGCEQLVAVHVMSRTDDGYEFAHDLMQEVLYEGTPAPLRVAYHRRAYDLAIAVPESAARHAEAAGMWHEAAVALLDAAAAATTRSALSDSEQLCTRAIQAAGRGDDEVQATRAYLARSQARQSLEDYPGALEDLTVGLDLATRGGYRELELLLYRELCGDVLVALGRPLSASYSYLEQGLRSARALGDRTREVDLLSRSAVLAANRLQFRLAVRDGEAAVAIARELDDPTALALALDGLKTPCAYLGDLTRLAALVTELEPLSRASGDLFRLQWCVFESAFIPLAAGDWADATARIEEALALNRRSGWVVFESWFLAHLGWVARLAGRLDEAVDHGRRSVAPRPSPAHPWWDATACAMYASSLVAADPEGGQAEAVRLLRRGLASADRTGAESYRLRCLAGLADLTGAPDLRDQAQLLLDRAELPDGTAWLHGVDAYVALCRAWIRGGDPAAARRVLEPLLRSGRALGWDAVLLASGAGAQTSSASAAPTRSAPPGRTGR